MKTLGWIVAALALAVEAQHTAAQDAGRQWQLGQQVLSVGSELDPTAQFSRIVNVLLLADSGLVVVNGGSMQLRFFDARGGFLRHSGREGAGPGEYR